MINQSKNKTLLFIIGILLLTNIVLVWMMLSGKPQDKRPERKSPMSAYLKSEVGFSPAQLVAVDSIKSRHRRDVKLLFDNMRNDKEQAFKALGKNGFSDSAINSAATYSASQQQALEIKMLSHLRDIRNVGTPEQKAKFDTGFYKVMIRGKNDNKPKEH
ncbi:MAG: hypothetical protein JWQ27_1499 [Ferruginibacter sp.]|nr:hypothetical protein [Ferruginibacter sp.]